MYKDKPFKMYKIFEEIYYSRDYDSIKAYHVLEEIANPFNKIMLNEYIYNEYKYKYGYKRKDNIHYLNTTDKSILRINNYNIKIETENNYSIFFNDINNYNKKLTSYNEYSNNNLKLYETTYNYIDYNNDNKYEEVKANE